LPVSLKSEPSPGRSDIKGGAESLERHYCYSLLIHDEDRGKKGQQRQSEHKIYISVVIVVVIIINAKKKYQEN